MATSYSWYVICYPLPEAHDSIYLVLRRDLNGSVLEKKTRT